MPFIVVATIVKLFAFGLLVRQNPHAALMHDTPSYTAPIEDLLHHASFTVRGVPEVQRTPGYPLLLALVTALFGNVLWSIPLQVLFGAATAVLTWELVQKTYEGPRPDIAASSAAILVLLAPSLALEELHVVADSLVTLVILGGVYCLCLFSESKRRWLLVAGTTILACAAYVKPIGLYLGIPLIAIATLSACWGDWSRSAAMTLVAVSLYAVLTGAWIVRNRAEAGIATFSSIASKNLYEYLGGATLARAEGRSWETVRTELQARMREKHLDLADEIREQRREGLRMLLNHPTDAMWLGVQGVATNALDPGTGDLANILSLRRSGTGLVSKYFSMGPLEFLKYLLRNERALLAFVAVGGVWILSFWTLVARGVWAYRHDWGTTQWLVVVTAAYLLVVAAGPNAMARFRVPAVPMLAYLAGMGAANVLPDRKGLEGKH